MTRAATCYVVPGKRKSEILCEAFVAGVRANGLDAEICNGSPVMPLPGAAVFYGVRPHQKSLLDRVIAQGREWYYIDNAYFDSTRETYFRVTRNRLQHPGTGTSDGRRLRTLNLPIAQARGTGSHILLCPQSTEFLRLFCPQGEGWLASALEALRRATTRELRVREWQADKVQWYRTLPEDLADCWALVTFSSASAITAMLHGVPAFVTAEDCIARPVANIDLAQVEGPLLASIAERAQWARVVADNQFTVDEIASGFAWRCLAEQDKAGSVAAA